MVQVADRVIESPPECSPTIGAALNQKAASRIPSLKKAEHEPPCGMGNSPNSVVSVSTNRIFSCVGVTRRSYADPAEDSGPRRSDATPLVRSDAQCGGQA